MPRSRVAAARGGERGWRRGNSRGIRSGAARDGPPVEVRLLGPLAVRRHGVAAALPASRKVRALLAYLALAPHPVRRSQLCELLWDGPSDPRGELRWCLSKIRTSGRRARPAPAGDRGRHRPARPGGRCRRCRRGRPGGAAGHRGDRAGAAAGAGRPVRRGLPRRAGDRAQPGLQQLADGAAPPLPRPPHRPAGASRHQRPGRAAARLSGGLAGAGALRSGACTGWCWSDTRPALAASAKAKSIWRRRSGTFEAEGLDRRHAAPGVAAPRGRMATPRSPRRPPRRGRLGQQPWRRCPRRPAPRLDRGDAVCPIRRRAGARNGVADALAHDVTTRLAKLRSLFVIAQGTVFALRDRRIGAGGRRADAECRLCRQRLRRGGRTGA